MYITNGPIADVLLIYAKTDGQGPQGDSAFVVEKSFPGFQVAQKLDKMGFRGSTTAELVFEDCVVPAANLVGEEDNGVAVVMSGLDLERAIIAMINLGMAERAFDLALEYAKTRKQFGRAIGEFQMIQAKLADMYTAVETIRISAIARWPRQTAWSSAPAAAATSTSSPPRPFCTRLRPLQGGERRGTDPRRRRLHARDRDQSALPRDQAARNRRGHDRNSQADNRGRIDAGLERLN